MKTPWVTIWDPLQLTKPAVVFGELEQEARVQGEDILFVECVISKKKKRAVDVGWYRERYLVMLVEDDDWESPIQKIECYDLGSAMEAFRKLSI